MTVLILNAPVVAQETDIPEELIHYPELVFTNGQVLTADADQDFSVAEAVAVRGNRILAVGTNAEVRRLAGPDTRRIDLRGRSLTPGFIFSDADGAVPAGDIIKESQWDGWIQPNLGGETIDQALATLSYIVDEKGKPGAPLFFNLQDQWAGTAMQVWGKSTLDEVAPDTPVIVYLDSSYSLVNSAMIDLIISEGFPSNHFHLDRDADGEYTGRAGAHVNGFVGREIRPWPSPEWFNKVAIPGAVKSLADYARNGITVATGHMSAPTMTVLNRLFHEQQDNLAIRVYPALDFLRQNPEAEKYLKRMGNLVDFSLADERGAMVTIIGASVGPHSGSPDAAASLLTIEPKTNVIPELSPNSHGWNRWTAEWFTGLGQDELSLQQKRQTDYFNVMLGRRHGWNVSGIHNMGSLGILVAMRNVLEAEQQEQKYVERLWRPQGFDHNIDWTSEVYEFYANHPELKDLIRFGISGTGIHQRDAEPLGLEKVIELQWGRDSMARMAPLRTLAEKGIPFHIEGSGPKNALRRMYYFITRTDERGESVAPEEAIDRRTAFLAMTRWGARYIGAEEEMGSIEPGNLADLVVFNGDIMEVPIEELPDLQPVMTLVGGRVSYEASEELAVVEPPVESRKSGLIP